ncbi:AI-2E family transporter, partial [Streptomyces sp. SID8380]|nr:AI-2E family transporter [Streptomyces sp. SID8380]
MPKKPEWFGRASARITHMGQKLDERRSAAEERDEPVPPAATGGLAGEPPPPYRPLPRPRP